MLSFSGCVQQRRPARSPGHLGPVRSAMGEHDTPQTEKWEHLAGQQVPVGPKSNEIDRTPVRFDCKGHPNC